MKISNEEIDNLLYSAIRSKKHLRVRRKSYFIRALQLIYLYFSVKGKKYIPNNKKVVLNYLNKTYIDFSKIEEDQDFKLDLEESQIKPLYFAEFFLIISFLINFKIVQRFFLIRSANIIFYLIKSRNIEMLICGHPDLLISHLGYCLNKSNKEVVTVQHGIYNLSSYEVLWWEKEVATTIFLYGRDFMNLYISQGVSPDKVKLGTPYFGSTFNQIDKKPVKLKLENQRVIFLGQQLYKISDSVFDGYNNFIAHLIEYYKERQVEVFYKPHPREDIRKSLTSVNISNLNFYNNGGKSDNLFSTFDIYYSVNSSILIELYLQKKICYQVDIPIDDFEYDNFDKFTGIPLVDIQTLGKELQNENYYFYYSPDYLNIQSKNNQYMVNQVNKMAEEKFLNRD